MAKTYYKLYVPPSAKVLAVVPSESRPDLDHTIYEDINGDIHCTCESHTFSRNPCKHMKDWASKYREPVEMGSKLAEQLLWILDVG